MTFHLLKRGPYCQFIGTSKIGYLCLSVLPGPSSEISMEKSVIKITFNLVLKNSPKFPKIA